MQSLPNFHIIRVQYMSATNSRPSRVKIVSDRFKQSKIVTFSHDFNNTLDIA
jgi:hypothetical protein